MDKKPTDILYRYRYALLFLLCAASTLFSFIGTDRLRYGAVIFCGVMAAMAVMFFRRGGLNESNVIAVILILGFTFRLCYVLTTAWYTRQHDVYGTDGHMDYILYLLSNGFSLPDFDVSSRWQFYQPPVWHYLCAAVLKITTFLGVELEQAKETLQFVSLYCSCGVMLCALRMFRLFSLSGHRLCAALALVAFHPTMIYLSGSINNDVLSLFLSLCALVLAMEWYKNPTLPRIIGIAVTLGFSMGAKLSGGVVAVPIALIFIAAFFRSVRGKRVLHMIGEFAAFLCVCVPLALWWQVRNYLRFGLSPFYVPKLSERNEQYIGFRSVSERLFDFSSVKESVYPLRATKRLKSLYGFTYFDFNIPVNALKSSLFGEYYLGIGSVYPKLLFVSAAVFALFSVIGALYLIVTSFAKKKEPLMISALAAYVLVLIGSYVKFCFEFPFYCTMDFRYIAALAVISPLFVFLALQRLAERFPRAGSMLSGACTALAGVFSVCSVLVFANIG